MRPLVSVLAAVGLCVYLALPSVAAADDAPVKAGASKAAAKIITSYGYSLYGKLNHPAGFTHFDYANPDAPKGGTVHMTGFGGNYDSFNPFSPRGRSGVSFYTLTLLYDSMMRTSLDETSAQYCYLCESVSYPDDYTWIEFKMRKTARWHDGKPITPEDVVFSFDTIRNHASPMYRQGLAEVAKAEITGPWTVRFTFNAPNRRLALNLGFMPMLAKHYWQGHEFEAPIVTPPLTSGPYKISSFDLGHSYTLTRVKDYWAKDLPVNKGQFNYDKIIYDFYRDSLVAFEAFKAGDVDVRWETSQKNWATAYVWPAAKHKEVRKATLPRRDTALYQGFFYNLRRPLFQDPVLREALGYAFDFSWINKNLLYGLMVRTKSYFTSTDLGARGLPSAEELKLLEPFRSQLPPRVFTSAFNPPDTDGTEKGLRNNLRTAAQMLSKAGYVVKDGKLISPKTKMPVTFEILMADPGFERVTNHWAENLKLIGITVNLRVVDLSQYLARTSKFDFDMIVGLIPFLPAPGTEIRNLWNSKAADIPRSFNWSGIKNPAVDALVEKVIAAKTQPELIAATRALDRVLLWNFYSIPEYSSGGVMGVAYWDRFGRPDKETWSGFPYQSTWWIDPAKDAALKAARGTSN